jgi:transcriptional regulator with XRE-family HTH domain
MVRTLTPHGAILEDARESRGIKKRDAARRAGISEALWRQYVTGVRSVARGVTMPVSTTKESLRKMANAVGADPVEVLRAAGHDVKDEEPSPLSPLEMASDDELLTEIRRRFHRSHQRGA